MGEGLRVGVEEREGPGDLFVGAAENGLWGRRRKLRRAFRWSFQSRNFGAMYGS